MNYKPTYLRIAALLLVTAISISVLTSCNMKKLSFLYEIINAKQAYRPGEQISVIATVVNNGCAFKETGASSSVFYPGVGLYCGNYRIEEEPYAHTCDVITKIIKKGDSGISQSTFVIPDNAVKGSYSISVGCAGKAKIFENVLIITD